MSSCDSLSKLEIQWQATSDFIHAFLLPLFSHIIYVIGFLATIDNNVPQAQITRYEGQHLMKVSIGIPPVDIYGHADTANDFVWTQCLPCDVCFNQINP